MHRVYLILFLVSYALSAAAEDSKTRSISEVEQDKSITREKLIENIASEDRSTRRRAVAELAGGFSEDPTLINELIEVVWSELSETSSLSKEARINLLFLLANATDSAWSPETAEMAQSAISAYSEKFISEAGEQERELLVSLSKRLNDLTGGLAYYGELQGRVEGKLQYTDLDLFVCEYAARNTQFLNGVRTFGEQLLSLNYGRIRVRRATNELAMEVGATVGSSTIIVDADSSEVKVAQQLTDLLLNSNLPSPRTEQNLGNVSRWYTSVFICPSPVPSQICHVDDVRPPDAFLALRSEPSAQTGGRLKRLLPGESFTFLGPSKENWWQVQIEDGTIGWISWQRLRWISC